MADKCGAKTRAGGRCRKSPLPNGRCRFHGGMSTGPKVPNTRLNAFKHGIYTRQLLPDEIALFPRIGNVDDEIWLLRLRLRRALAAEAAAKGAAELESIIERQLIGEEGSKKDTTSKVRDYNAIIRSLVRDIEALERTRRDLLLKAAPGGDEDEDTAPIGRIVVEVVSARASHDHDRAAG